MVSKQIIINIPNGLHLRPISELCNRAIDYKSTIEIKSGDKIVNAKSVLGVLSACIKFQDEICLTCDGPDEEEALEDLSSIINNWLNV